MSAPKEVWVSWKFHVLYLREPSRDLINPVVDDVERYVLASSVESELAAARADLSRVTAERDEARKENEDVKALARMLHGDCPGYTVRTVIGYGHGCGGDEETCARICPVPEQEEEQEQCQVCDVVAARKGA